ncbi:MAG TPA: DUF1634 domain-containing protein [Terriglobales bacterium]|nr:DUF1634 domain-containing protein [Terriglobales bacterium]
MPETFSEPAARVYAVVYRVLYWGMLISTALFTLGVLRALQHPRMISLGPALSQSLGTTLRGLAALDPASLMLAATVVLILTPVARVVMALLAFWRDGDAGFVAVTGVVLGVIVLTVILGRLGLH